MNIFKADRLSALFAVRFFSLHAQKTNGMGLCPVPLRFNSYFRFVFNLNLMTLLKGWLELKKSAKV